MAQNSYINYVNQRVHILFANSGENVKSENDKKSKIYHYEEEKKRYHKNIKRLQAERRELTEELKKCRPGGPPISPEIGITHLGDGQP